MHLVHRDLQSASHSQGEFRKLEQEMDCFHVRKDKWRGVFSLEGRKAPRL